jgi:1-acyl-sn-glycerol-3-phosphate acyltransferase
VPLLYDAVALGMSAYTRAAFRVDTLGGANLRLRPGTLLVVTHRRETDVPLVCPSLYRFGRMWEDRSHRIAFAAREDLHEPGFFSGFPARLPLPLRRALFRVEIGSVLMNDLLVLPLRSAAILRLHGICRELPGLPLESLPGEVAEALRARAREVGRPIPARAGEVLQGDYGDLLWRTFRREQLDGVPLETLWSRRAAEAAGDFRRLVEIVSRGAVLLVFPEGRPSPDGEIGPVRPGLAALVRRGKPRWLQPIGIAYDPLVRGRTRAFVSFSPPLAVPAGDVEEAVVSSLRLAVPLTAGQVVA